jgi:hypothetical protein
MCVGQGDRNVYYDLRFKMSVVNEMAMQKTTLVTFLVVGAVGIAVVSLVSGLLLATRTIPTVGSFKAVEVGVYWNSACTNQTTSIDWGTLSPSATKSYTVYVKNNGTVPVTLSMASGNWNPASASTYMRPSWNCTNYVLNSGSLVAAALTLTVWQNVTGIVSFGFDITITGTE